MRTFVLRAGGSGKVRSIEPRGDRFTVGTVTARAPPPTADQLAPETGLAAYSARADRLLEFAVDWE